MCCSRSGLQEQHEILLRSFQSVKFEFHDLDGLAWTDSVRQELRQISHAEKPKENGESTFAVLSNADLASFSPDDTIRIPAVRICTSELEPELEPLQQAGNYITSRYGKRDGTRVRSPIKGLFSIPDGNTHTASDKPLPKTSATDVDERTLRLKDPPSSICTDKVQFPAALPKSPTMDASVITSIFRSPNLSSKHRRIISQTCYL
ncbi:hypothetical protein AX15_004165 [Amanita polypyramis BW_CC]|nr:hypothetical protein AX15_004165 [Amanita polypyramis BW_CC]